MPPPPIEPPTPMDRRGSKRSAADTVERGAKRIRDEEKENLRASTSSNSLESGRRSRKSKPAKREDDLEKSLPTCQMKELLQRFQQRATVDSRGNFLVRNVIQGRRIRVRGSEVVVKQKSRENLQETTTRLMKSKGTGEELFSVAFDRIMSWATTKEAKIEKASTSLLKTYAVIVNENGIDEISGLGASVVPLVPDRPLEEDVSTKRVFADKLISYSPSKVVSVRCIFLVVIATRMVPKYEEGERRTRGTAIAGNEFVEETRYGCKMLLDTETKVNLLNSGLQHVILLNESDNKAFAEPDKTAWMKDLLHLKDVNKANKSTEDSNLPRVIILTHQSDEKDTTPTPEDKEQRHENQTRVQCPIRNTFFPSVEALKENFQARYPCFTLQFKKHQIAEVNFSNAYFGSDVNEAMQCFRKHSDRTVPRSIRASSEKTLLKVVEEVGEAEEKEQGRANNTAPRNVAPHSTKPKFGPECIQTPGQLHVMQVVYKDRTDSILPSEPHPPFVPDDDEPEEEESTAKSKKKKKPRKRMERHEVFPVNNSKLFCDMALYNKHAVSLSVADSVGKNEMLTVAVPVTHEETVAFNKRLLDRYKTRNKQGKVVSVENVPDVDPEAVETPGVDFEGNLIPTCSELFFEKEKSEIYNIYCRFYFAEAGLRPGAWSAKTKSRALTGLIVRWHEEIFAHGLEQIFLKHVQIVSGTTCGWTREDTLKPLEKYKELRTIWEEQQKNKKTKK